MEDILLAVYKRPDTYEGKKIYHRADRYYTGVELRCYKQDNSAERKMGIMVNGQPCPDYYDILVLNHKGEGIYRHHEITREGARERLKTILHNYPDFKRVQ